MATTETGTISIDGVPTYYRASGEGPPMIFVHGWTLDTSYWDAQVAHFAPNYRTYCYDFRGTGQSGGATPPFTMEQLGTDLAGLIAALGIQKPIICGHSEGGAIAAQYAATNPDAISALILADTELDSPADLVQGAVSYSLTTFFAALEEKEGKNPLVGMMPNLEKELYSPGFISAQPAFIASWQKQFLSNSADGVLNGLRAWTFRGNVAQPLQKFSAPTLLMWGMADAMISFKQMQALQASLGGVSQLTTLAGSGHMSPVEVPDQFNRVSESFLKDTVSHG